MKNTLTNATVSFFNVWASVVDLDERGPSKEIGYFSTESAALEFAKGKGWWGSDGWATAKCAIQVNDAVFLLGVSIDVDGELEKKKDLVRKNALAKLSPEEIEALNIKQ